MCLAAVRASAVDDPTRPPTLAPLVANQVVNGLPRLNSILISKNRKLAVIGGATYSEGQRKRGLRLVSIEPSEVHVRTSDGELKTLTLSSNKIQKESK